MCVCVYINNLFRCSDCDVVLSSLQWTTDEDLTDAIRSIGINDVLEIKFFENRANGQSKG